MTTPEARPAAPVYDTRGYELEADPPPCAEPAFDGDAWNTLTNDGQLWQREAERAASAELDALNGTRRLEPEPSSMARTGLALGLAFTSDDAKA